MNRKTLFTIAASLLLLTLIAVFVPMPAPVSGAPAAAPTPITADASGAVPQVVEFFNARAITADTTSPCIDLSAYTKADFYYNIDHGTTNTTTLTLRFGNSSSALVDGINLKASSTSDEASLNQFQLFGRDTCVLANVANGNTITITVNALVR
jgi:hypothetical protein